MGTCGNLFMNNTSLSHLQLPHPVRRPSAPHPPHRRDRPNCARFGPPKSLRSPWVGHRSRRSWPPAVVLGAKEEAPRGEEERGGGSGPTTFVLNGGTWGLRLGSKYRSLRYLEPSQEGTVFCFAGGGLWRAQELVLLVTAKCSFLSCLGFC